jgi:hypothetical protein
MSVVLSRLLLWGVALAFGQLPLRAALFLMAAPADTNAPASSANLSIGWDPSPTSNAAGYFLCYGVASGACTNRLDVGNVTSVTAGGLETNVTYYLTVVAYDGIGTESPPSNEIEYAPSGGSSAAEPPRINLQIQDSESAGEILRVSFQGDAGVAYHVQASEDLRQWVTILTTNCVSDGLILFESADLENYQHRFYRVLR